jgi:thiol-disulfide isomerase/thioredoxin
LIRTIKEEEMGRVKLFWKEECPNCGSAKIVGSQLKQEGLAVYDYNLDTADGLAEASYYSIMSTPTIIIEDEEENTIASFSGSVPTPGEVRRVIAKHYQ